MAHRLDPPTGSMALSSDEIERRLRFEFGHVEADVDGGAEVVASMIRQFERMKVPSAIVEEHRQLLPSAVRFVVADTPNFVDAYLCFTAMLDRGLLIGYHSARHERQAGPLLGRRAHVLGYDVTLV